MISKILKIELLTLFLATAISFIAFYYQDFMPDNFFSISSETAGSNFLSYYTTSGIALVGYYMGPWIFFPFLFFVLLYAFKFSHRDLAFDTFNVFTLTGSLLLITYFVYPSLLGKGMQFLIDKYFSKVDLLIMALALIIIFCAGVFRNSFKESMLELFHFLRKAPSLLWNSLSLSNGRVSNSVRSLKDRMGETRAQLLSKTSLILKGEKIASVDEKKSVNPFSENLKKFEQEDFQEASFEKPELKKDRDQKSEIQEPLAAPLAKTEDKPERKIVQPKLFKNKPNTKLDADYYAMMTSLSAKRTAHKSSNPDDKYFHEIIGLIEDKLQEFRIDGKIINVLKGPVVDTFELELGAGVKVSKVTGASEDLSLALYGAPIRIVYPMKGRTTIGIEVPRNPRDIIYLDEVLSSDDFKKNSYHLPIAMGKDAFGETFVVDLASMPHMLVAGATGAGKSVFINTLLVSLLVKKSPRQMRLILIDPKQLELALYAKLPHLVMPVITDAKTASISLLWAVQEMERRYSILKELGVRNIEGFNQKLKRATPEMLSRIHQYYEDGDADGYELPYLVIVVDEFADLILTKAGKEIENNICRLAAKARAAGVHLVLATQRPSVDVITGLIKSNFPTRVSFRVTTSVDSRTILNAVGAEKLLGKGDMLYKHGVETSRVHSSYVDEEEIEVLAQKLESIESAFHPGAMDFLENGGEKEPDPYAFGSHISSPKGENSGDELYDEAVKIVMEHRSASASMLQRRMRIGYNRAANLIEQMEAQGVVGPAQGSKPRQILSGPTE